MRLSSTAALLTFGVIIYNCELAKDILLKFAPIMPAFCSLLFHSYYVKIYAGKIDLSLVMLA